MSTCAELPQFGCCDNAEPPGLFRIVINPIDMFPRFFSGTVAERTEMFHRARVAIGRLPFPATSFDTDFYTWEYGEDVPVYRRTNGGTAFDVSSETGADGEGRIVAAASLIYMKPGPGSDHAFSFCRIKLSSTASFAFPGVPIQIGSRNFEESEIISASETRPMVEDVSLVHWRYVVPAEGFVIELAPREAVPAANEVSPGLPCMHQAYWGPL